MSDSTRLQIVQKALEEVFVRLRETEPSEQVKALTRRAFECDLELSAWRGDPPEEEARRALVANVMDLAIEAMRLPAATTSGPGPQRAPSHGREPRSKSRGR